MKNGDVIRDLSEQYLVGLFLCHYVSDSIEALRREDPEVDTFNSVKSSVTKATISVINPFS